MIQSIYTQVSNANLVPCNKKEAIKSDPIPLLKHNFLGEYRTALEKAKVRKNLGIADTETMEWGNLFGFIENQKDLVDYVEGKWKYTLPDDITNIQEELTNIQDAVNYAIKYVSTFKSDTDSIVYLKEQVQLINSEITEIKDSVNKDVSDIKTNLETLNKFVTDFEITIANWFNSMLENSTSMELNEKVLEVKVSKNENNALQIEEDGLFVNDFSKDLETLQNLLVYSTVMEDTTEVAQAVGGIYKGTKAESLKGKTFNQLFDMMLFPTVVRDLIYPTLTYSYIQNLVEVGNANQNPILTFTQNDAGPEISRKEVLLFESEEINTDTYDQLGTYVHRGQVEYSAGQYLINNKGEETTIRVEAGTKETFVSVTTTYPWYAGNTQETNKQQLVKFNQSSGNIEITLSGRSVIKLPGKNTTLNTFDVWGLGGYIPVDMSGWKESEETINGCYYKVFTKDDTYSEELKHQLNFTLKQ